MPVSDFECQIARGQIGRYLDGGMLSPEAMKGLEEHLGECPGCKSLVAERRAALLGTLDGPTRAVVSMPVENPLVAALRARASQESPPVEAPKAAPRYARAPAAKGSFGKPMALAALLAMVLVGMSRFSHTASSPASKAAASFAAESIPEKRPSPAPTPKVEPPKRTVAKPIEPIVPSPPPSSDARETPKPKISERKPVLKRSPSAPKRVVRHAKRAVRRVAGARKRRQTSRNTVRVYGLDGHPLKP